MSRGSRRLAWLGLVWVLVAAACSPAAVVDGSLPASATGSEGAMPATSAAPPQPSTTPSNTPETVPTSLPPASFTPTATDLPVPTPCPPGMCASASQFIFQRPVAAPGNQQVDITYRFGSTQGRRRDPHHGVEFLNPGGTPVLAAADGVVVVAGDDRQPISPHGAWPILFYGPYSYFYGNLVVIEHPLPAEFQRDWPDATGPLYTLYAHLSEIGVQVGQAVQAGQEVGKVGMTGVATGNHLHFEVRLGENSYKQSRNPELWLIPGVDEKGQPLGALAGRVLDRFGNSVELTDIVLRHLPNGPDQPHGQEFYLMTYEEKGLRSQPPFLESFAAGDLPAGWYKLTFPYQGLREFLVQVFPAQLTVLTLQPE